MREGIDQEALEAFEELLAKNFYQMAGQAQFIGAQGQDNILDSGFGKQQTAAEFIVEQAVTVLRPAADGLGKEQGKNAAVGLDRQAFQVDVIPAGQTVEQLAVGGDGKGAGSETALIFPQMVECKIRLAIQAGDYTVKLFQPGGSTLTGTFFFRGIGTRPTGLTVIENYPPGKSSRK